MNGNDLGNPQIRVENSGCETSVNNFCFNLT